MAFAIYSLVLSTKNDVASTTILYNWSILSQQTQTYYYNSDIKSLANSYHNKMLVTGLLYLLIVIINSIVLVYSLKLFCNLEERWRPTLRSKFSDARAKRFIEMYKTLQASRLADIDKPFIPAGAKQSDFRGDVNKILENDKDKDLFDERKVKGPEEEQKVKTKRALPKKKKTDRPGEEYQKVEQKDS